MEIMFLLDEVKNCYLLFESIFNQYVIIPIDLKYVSY
jgi:hypothetical protein